MMEILYFDKNIVVCVKPVGVDSEREMPELLKEELGGEIYTLHRLDMNVGGVMVYARNKEAAAELSDLIRQSKLKKEYIALVHGETPAEGEWEDLLWHDRRRNKTFVVDRVRRGVKKARLEFARLEGGMISRVRVKLHTGRSHQIRVQFASRGYPLVGDHKYGSRDKSETPMLFSCKLEFVFKDKVYSFEAMPLW